MNSKIFGYGNTLREDDGFGCAVSESLEKLNLPDTEIIQSQQLIPEMVYDLQEADLVIFIDASLSQSPGEICWRRLDPQSAADSSSLSHHLDANALLSLAHYLFNSQPEAYLLAVGAVSLGTSEQLSPALQAILPQIVQELEKFILWKTQATPSGILRALKPGEKQEVSYSSSSSTSSPSGR